MVSEEKLTYYRPTKLVMDISLIELEFDGSIWLCKENAGSRGEGNLIKWLLRYKTIFIIVGLSFGFFWTHNKPIWMHLITSNSEQFSFIFGSNMHNGVWFLYCLHTCNQFINLVKSLNYLTLKLNYYFFCTMYMSNKGKYC